MHGGGCVLPRRRHSIFYKTRIQGRNQLRFNYYHHVRTCLLIELVGFFCGKLKTAIFAKNREHSLYAQNGILFIGNTDKGTDESWDIIII